MSTRTFTFSVQSAVASSALSNAISGLSTGQWVDFDATGLSTISYGPLYGLKWVNRFFYDSVNRKAYFLSKSEGGRPYFVGRYSELAGTWEAFDTGLAEFGHIYESFGYDPDTQDLYTGRWLSPNIRKASAITGTPVWTDPVNPMPFTENFSADIQSAMAWHPNLFGAGDGGLVIMAGRTNTAGRFIGWRKNGGTWHTLASWSSANNGESVANSAAVVYCAGLDAVIATDSYIPGGPSTTNDVVSLTGATYLIAAGSGGSSGSVTPIADPPIGCTYTAYSYRGAGVLVDDPNGGGPYILEKCGTNQVWKWNGSQWELQAYTHPFTYTNPSMWVVAACNPPASTHGALWCIPGEVNAAQPTRLWRPNT